METILAERLPDSRFSSVCAYCMSLVWSYVLDPWTRLYNIRKGRYCRSILQYDQRTRRNDLFLSSGFIFWFFPLERLFTGGVNRCLERMAADMALGAGSSRAQIGNTGIRALRRPVAHRSVCVFQSLCNSAASLHWAALPSGRYPRLSGCPKARSNSSLSP